MSKLHNLLLALPACLRTPSVYDPYYSAPTVDRTYGDVPHPDTRQLREFSINGQKIMAYSRKDAIKRLKHKKK